ncbi:amidohydrolase [Lentzea sp. NBRC 105346]|uniref:amidohydrolase family protein n=1 Tax=Lentzea sp. NBRC 105346 TaxID=3032205 RepID=UPI0024A11F63|nr:amidohydrolase family protein [Lentzea sp. NBRC 105346]GLZ31747.1 amidohydrolase [Lentzea sp. NBRC 105346]
MDLSRRDFLATTGLVAAGLGVTGVAQADSEGGVRLTEGTNMSAALSPDGTRIAIDLVTAIWVLPASGGTARRLTGELQDATLPSWSPDGKQIVFQSYRDGNYHLWSISAEGGEPRQLTTGRFDHREPVFSPDGTRIAFTSDRGGSYGVWLLEVATGRLTQLTGTPDDVSAPQWSADGQRILFAVNENAVDVLTVATGVRERVATAPAGGRIYGPAFGPGAVSYTLATLTGADLVLGDKKVTTGEDVFGFAAKWLGDQPFYTANGKIKRGNASIPFEATVSVASRWYRHRVRDLDSPLPRPVRGIASPVASPDGTQLAFRALNAIHLVPVAGGQPRKITDGAFFDSDPDFAPDGKSIVYSSDRTGVPTLRLRNLASGEDRELAPSGGAQTIPRFSRDGKKIAFVDQDGAVWVLDVAAGTRQQITPPLFMPGRPTWSPDGTVVALAAVKPFSRRFREGTSQILTVDLKTGELRYTEPMPFRSIATRGDDGPVWSPDGRHLAFVVESVAWVVPVDGAGRFTASPRQVTREVTDSLTWLGSELVYLHDGVLRRIGIDGGQPRSIPLKFKWRRRSAPSSLVIHAGAVWDGEAEELRQDVDIVISQGRIEEIRPHRTADVDASDLVAMPGLIDAHNHWHLRGRQWGGRQGRLWLSYGITTTRSPGDPVYQMLETREALDSGALVGPRFLATGEAIDGSRVYYNFMRPTLSPEQLGLELERAFSLDYDMIKTYVRLPVALQKETVSKAHRKGVPLSSHYLYPAAAVGMDGMEHVGATNRLGYSHTVSRTGRAYQDVVELFVKSGMSVTTTLFHSHALYPDDMSLVNDERTRVLFPSWEYQRYVASATSTGMWSRHILAGWVDMVLRIHRAGGMVLCGTDTPLDTIGTSLHQNMRAMVAFGFTPREALITATRNPASWLGMSGRIGVLRPGAYADISLVSGSPLADIRAAAAVQKVVAGGVVHTVDSLLAPYRGVRPSSVSAAVAPLETHPSCWWHEPEWSVHACCGH